MPSPMPSPGRGSPPFYDLLRRLALEHEREVAVLTERVFELGGPLAGAWQRSGPYSVNQQSLGSEGFASAGRMATRKPSPTSDVTDRLENIPLGDNQAPKEPSGSVHSPRFRETSRSPVCTSGSRRVDASGTADTMTETSSEDAQEIRISLACPAAIEAACAACQSVKLQPSRKDESVINRWEFVFMGAIEKQEVDHSFVTLKPEWAGYVERQDSLVGTLLDRMFLAGAGKAMRKSTEDASRDTMRKKTTFKELRDPMKVTKTFAHEYLRPKVIHPNSRKRGFWDAGGLTLVLHDLVMIPMSLFSLQTPHGGELSGVQDGNWVFDMISTIFWTIDMVISFLTGYHSAEGFVEMRPPFVVRNYLRSWFPLDAVIVTVDWASLIFLSSSVSSYMRLGKTVPRLTRLIRVFRLLRFMKLNQSLNTMLELVKSEYLLQIISLMKLVVLIVVINHYIACCWYALSTVSSRRSWATAHVWESEDQNKKTWAYAYVTSLHWSLTQFTPASMEVFPQNTFERAFNVVVIIMAMVTFSSFVSSITAAMTHIRNINARKLEQETAIRRYFQDHKISKILVSRVWHFLRRNRGGQHVLREKDIAALQVLPERVREELRRERLAPVLTVHPLIATWSQVDRSVVGELCGRALEERALNPHEELYGSDREVPSMLFVVAGSLEYNCSEGTEVPLRVRCGEWACELALWGDHATLSGPFVAGSSGCDLVFLVADRFGQIASERPSGGIVAIYGEAFIALFNEKVADLEFTNLLFNDPDTPQELVSTALTMANVQDADRTRSSASIPAARGLKRGSTMAWMISTMTSGKYFSERSQELPGGAVVEQA